MSTIRIESGVVAGVKADLVKNEVRITLAFPLNEDMLELRDQLAELAEEQTHVDVSLSALQIMEPKSPQMRLEDVPVDGENGHESVALQDRIADQTLDPVERMIKYENS